MAKKKRDMKKAVKRAKRLLEAMEKHAAHALKEGVPRAIYVQAVADHAAATYDRLRKPKREGELDDGAD